MVSVDQDSVEAVATLTETSSDGPPANHERQKEQEEHPIHNAHNERSEAQPESESSEFEFQDAYMPLAVCLLWQFRSSSCFKD
jgi:hypothetical protein